MKKSNKIIQKKMKLIKIMIIKSDYCYVDICSTKNVYQNGSKNKTIAHYADKYLILKLLKLGN
jgi:hypothetical protein